MMTLDDDTTPTEEDGLLDQLRRDGVIGPFRVCDSAGGSDVGLHRKLNEDAWIDAAGRLFAVADGLGGHEGGEVASGAVVEAMGAYVGFVEADADSIVKELNQRVVVAGRAAGLTGLGTTLVAVSVHRSHVVVLNVGDSRVYRFRQRELDLLTTDHTVRNELVASGVPLEAAARSNVRLDALTSHLGRATEEPAKQAASYSVMAGDRFLLCTDGVHGQIEHEDIARLLSGGTCRDSVAALLDLARVNGGRDNATAIVIDFEREGP